MSQNRPYSPYKIARFILLVGLVTWGATCTACHVPAQIGLRSPTEQYTHAVRILVTCAMPSPDRIHTDNPEVDAILNTLIPDIEHQFGGSGVFISPSQVLTNDHVIDCTDGTLKELFVVTDDDKPHKSTVEVRLPSRDIARIRLDVPLNLTIDAPALGPKPEIGDKICAATALPYFSYRCSDVQPYSGDRILTDDHVLHGNSGSAVYDARGRIIGLIRATVNCDGMPCIGQVTEITPDISWILHGNT